MVRIERLIYRAEQFCHGKEFDRVLVCLVLRCGGFTPKKASFLAVLAGGVGCKEYPGFFSAPAQAHFPELNGLGFCDAIPKSVDVRPLRSTAIMTPVNRR